MNALEFKLPLVGLATSSYEFSKENPEAEVRQLHGGKLWGFRYWSLRFAP